jgi:hypothetical protein
MGKQQVLTADNGSSQQAVCSLRNNNTDQYIRFNANNVTDSINRSDPQFSQYRTDYSIFSDTGISLGIYAFANNVTDPDLSAFFSI